MNKQEEKIEKGDMTMNANVIKPSTPFVTCHHELKRTPMSEENRVRKAYMDSHEFSMDVNKTTGKMSTKVTKR